MKFSMTVAYRVVGLVVASLLGTSVAGAQSTFALQLEAGVGREYLTGVSYNGGARTQQMGAANLLWSAPGSSLTLRFGVDGEGHTGAVTPNCPLIAFADGHHAACSNNVPSLFGGHVTVGADYAVTSRLSIGTAVGAGYLNTNDSHLLLPSGSRVRSVQSDVAFAMNDHMTFVGRAEQWEMPDYGGAYVRARPVSFLVRFR